jgi:hypothetical protein
MPKLAPESARGASQRNSSLSLHRMYCVAESEQKKIVAAKDALVSKGRSLRDLRYASHKRRPSRGRLLLLADEMRPEATVETVVVPRATRVGTNDLLRKTKCRCIRMPVVGCRTTLQDCIMVIIDCVREDTTTEEEEEESKGKSEDRMKRFVICERRIERMRRMLLFLYRSTCTNPNERSILNFNFTLAKLIPHFLEDILFHSLNQSNHRHLLFFFYFLYLTPTMYSTVYSVPTCANANWLSKCFLLSRESVGSNSPLRSDSQYLLYDR